VRYGVGSVHVFRLPHEPAACFLGESRTGSQIVRKALKRALERLRTLTNGTFGKRTHARGGLQEPQRMQPVGVPAQSPAHR
jgi:hypothetical protein